MKCMVFISLLLMISSTMVPIEHDTVMPLWFSILSRSPFPFQILVIIPIFHYFGDFSSAQNAFTTGIIMSTIASPPVFSSSFFQSVVAFLFFLSLIASSMRESLEN